MSKVFTAFVVLVSVFLLPFTAHSELKIPFTGGSAKIGYVDILKALNESDKGKKAKQDLENIIKKKQSTIDDKGQEIKRLTDELSKQSSILSEGSRKDKGRELERLRRDYQRMVKDSQDEVKTREMEFTQNILGELREIVKKIGKDESFTLIITDPFVNLDDRKGLLLYVDKQIDLTEEVISRYNKGSK
jgi:outer membrane protein